MPKQQRALKSDRSIAGPALAAKNPSFGNQPSIWRRVLVPVSYTLRELHGVIQVAMGWESIHLYRFLIDGVYYGSSDLHIASADLPLRAIRLRTGARFL